jgi:hypothetical protein
MARWCIPVVAQARERFWITILCSFANLGVPDARPSGARLAGGACDQPSFNWEFSARRSKAPKQMPLLL